MIGAMLMLVVSSALSQDKTGEEYYRLPVGTTWRLIKREGNKEATLDIKVVEVKDGKVIQESKETRSDGGAPKVESVAWWTEGGFLMWGKERAGRPRLDTLLLKLGSRKGDTWESAPAPDPKRRGTPGQATHMGIGELTVPAGTYKDALHVRIESPGGIAMDYYLAPKVGVIKMVVKMPDALGVPDTTFELSEFKSGN